MIDGIRQIGLDVLPWDKESRAIVSRAEWLRKTRRASSLPDLSNAALTATLDVWLAPYLNGIRRIDQLQTLNLSGILRAQFSFDGWRNLERLAPSHLTLPSGTHAALDYSAEQPVLAVRLQELFGQTNTPTICDGTINVLLHILSPARRPLAVTQDLGSFWKTVYPEIRSQMRARYPKHPWPEDPLTAKPTNKTVSRR